MPSSGLLLPPTARQEALRGSLSDENLGPGYLVGGLPFEAATAIWERLWTSRYPLAADEFDDGVWRQTRAAAMTRQHVELHPKHVWGLIGVDVDHPDAVLRMVSTVDNHPPPNVIIENPVNGHAHAAWAITTPIKITNYGSRRSVRYGLSIEEALRRAVGGDPHYPARLIKNPFHPRWMTHFIHADTSTLDRFGGIPDPRPGTCPDVAGTTNAAAPPSGTPATKPCSTVSGTTPTGKCATTGATLRATAPRSAREVAIRNADFAVPLGVTELGHISTSIADWTIRYSRMWNDGPAAYDKAFRAIQAARGRKGGVKGSGRNGGLTGNSRPGGHARGEDRADTSDKLRDMVVTAALL
ncbi:replication initiation protein [Pseudonocardia sp. Ae707_Ps2]|uniref:replication initiation protein n=1 Tax=Pseudonocardia sp. Ae707_Ps2 TaxID=2212992 RepID=UPI00307EF7BE